MKKQSSERAAEAASAPRMTQPEGMKTANYVYGVQPLNGNDAWALFEASAHGNVAKVTSLLKKNPRLVNAQYWYQFPIHLAVYAGHAAIVKLLLDSGADPGQSLYTYNSWDKLLRCATERGYDRIASLLQRAMYKGFYYTPEFDLLKEAIIARDERKITAVVKKNPDLVWSSDALGNNPLHWSVITRQLGLIKRFVELGTPIDAQRADGQTPVSLAVNGATDYWYRATRGKSHPSLRNTSVLVGALLALGAEYTISVAAAVGDQERVEELLKKNPRLAKERDSARISPLTYAASEGHLHLVRLLLDKGADPNLPEEAAPNGLALFEACRTNHLPIAELLLEHGANPNAGVDSSGCCLTIVQTYHGDQAKPLQELLRRHGAQTPPYAMNARQLEQAIVNRDEVIRHDEFASHVLGTDDPQLLDMYLDAEPTAVNDFDATSIVEHPKSTELIAKLLARGLDPNHTDWLGYSLLHACAEQGNQSVAEILLVAGADINAREVADQGTPLASAVRSCCSAKEPEQSERARKMIEFLLEHGANPHLPDDKSWATPIAWAERYGREDLVELLNASPESE